MFENRSPASIESLTYVYMTLQSFIITKFRVSSRLPVLYTYLVCSAGHSAGISKKAIKLRPVAVIKGWTIFVQFTDSSQYVATTNHDLTTQIQISINRKDCQLCTSKKIIKVTGFIPYRCWITVSEISGFDRRKNTSWIQSVTWKFLTKQWISRWNIRSVKTPIMCGLR